MSERRESQIGSGQIYKYAKYAKVDVQKKTAQAESLTFDERQEVLQNLSVEISEIKEIGTKEEKEKVLPYLEQVFEIYRNHGKRE